MLRDFTTILFTGVKGKQTGSDANSLKKAKQYWPTTTPPSRRLRKPFASLGPDKKNHRCVRGPFVDSLRAVFQKELKFVFINIMTKSV